MRVSERMRYDLALGRVESAKKSNAKALERLSSQRDITKISDDPIGATQVIQARDKISNIRQYQRNIEYSRGFLERTETSIEGVTSNLIRAKELAIAMSNDTYDAQSREATGREIREIIQEVVQLGNTSFNGRYIFSGFRNRTPAVDDEGNFLGDDGAIFLQTSDGTFRQINLQARDLFEATPEDMKKGHFNLVTTLELLHEGLVVSDKNMINTALGELDHQLDKTTSYQAKVGGMWNSLNNSHRRLEKEEELARVNLSKIQDADVYDATSEFKRTETVLQSTLLASNKLLQPSLLNFMQ